MRIFTYFTPPLPKKNLSAIKALNHSAPQTPRWILKSLRNRDLAWNDYFIYLQKLKTFSLFGPKFFQKLPKHLLNMLNCLFGLKKKKKNGGKICWLRLEQHQTLLSMISTINIKLFSTNRIEWTNLQLISFGLIVTLLMQNRSWARNDGLLCQHWRNLYWVFAGC